MNLENLLEQLEKSRKIKKQVTGLDYLNSSLLAAKRNLQAAQETLDKFEEAAFKLAYDGLLQISRVVVLLNGYRPIDGEQHKTTFIVAGAILGEDFNDLIIQINSFRVKRNNCIYDPKLAVTKTEAEVLLKTAQEYWRKVRDYLKEKDSQLELFEF